MEQIHSNFKPGDRIQASNGEKRPPDRWNKKLSAWKNRNFTGTVKSVGKPDEYQPYGSLVLMRDDYPDRPHVTFDFHHSLGGSVRFEILE